jgi:DNA-binding transcriptional ArsR family regulator
MDGEIRQKVLDLIHSRPRAISEIAENIGKNWRTADRYVEQLASEGLIKVHVFRKGGRGALKISYWPSSIGENPSAMKNFLLQKILNGTKKEHFSSLDILQHVKKNKRIVQHLTGEVYHGGGNVSDFFKAIDSAKKQILYFSGNLSFTNMGDKYKEQLDLIEKKIKQGVEMYYLTRVDVSNKKTILDLLEINKKGHSGKIEIRYSHQPLRCTVVDDSVFYMKEGFSCYTENKKEDKENEWTEGEYIYTINDKEWVNWISDVFWHIWRGSVDCKIRLNALDEIREKK